MDTSDHTLIDLNSHDIHTSVLVENLPHYQFACRDEPETTPLRVPAWFDNLDNDRPPSFEASRLDRYDAAGLLTWRTTKRYEVKRKSSGDLSKSGVPQNKIYIPAVFRMINERIAEKTSEKAPKKAINSNVSRTMAKDGRKGLVLPPAEVVQRKIVPGSAMLDILSDEVILCIVDHLYFPDAFQLAMTCKTLRDIVRLKHKKVMYRKALRDRKGLTSSTLLQKDFCDSCIYLLDSNYFRMPEGAEERLCLDCIEIRQQKNTSSSEQQQSDKPNGRRLFSPIWRPSIWEMVPDTDGFLQYRVRA